MNPNEVTLIGCIFASSLTALFIWACRKSYRFGYLAAQKDVRDVLTSCNATMPKFNASGQVPPMEADFIWNGTRETRSK